MKSCFIIVAAVVLCIITIGRLSAQVSAPIPVQESSANALFAPNFFLPDTSKTEYAGLFAQWVVGGFSTRLRDYPDTIAGVSSFTPQTMSFRSFAFGLGSDSPLRFPFLTRRQNNEWLKGIRFGMQVEAQLSDISIIETSDSGTVNGVVQRGKFLHSMFGNLRSFAMTPSLRYTTLSGLSLHTGFRLGLVNSSNIRLVDSLAPTLPDVQGRLLRDVIETPISGLRADEFSVQVGVAYNLRPDKTLQIRPELVLNIPLLRGGDVTAPWRDGLWSLRMGMNMMFNTQKVIPVPDTIYKRDTALIMVAYTQKPFLALLSRSTEVRPAEYPDDPPTIFITESYKRDIPKPKPLLTASIDAEFALANDAQNFRRSVTLQAEKTVCTLTPVCINATNASIYAAALQDYFKEQNLWQKILPLENTVQMPQSTSNTFSTTNITTTATALKLIDTLVLVGRLPLIRFTPRIVTELPLKGVRLRVFQKSQSSRRELAMFLDSGETGHWEAVPILWNPAKMPDVLLSPNERMFYVLTVIDEEGLESPADSGIINLRTEPITGTLGLKRSLDVYAFEPDLPLADFMRSLVGINISNAEKIGIVPPETSDTTNASETALRLQLMERTLPKAERTRLTFLPKPLEMPSFNTSSEANILVSSQEERLRIPPYRQYSLLSRMMLVFVERRL